MRWTMLRSPAYAVGVIGTLLISTAGTMGCGLLEVSDPTAIEADELDNAAGAQLLRGDAIRRWQTAVGDLALAGGVLSDEYFTDASLDASWYDPLDRRASVEMETAARNHYEAWLEVRHAATHAMAKLRAHAPPGAKEAQVGEMFALRGFGTLGLAENFCPGFPLHDIVDDTPVYSAPLSTDQALERARDDFDSALAYAADSARVFRMATLGRARTLLALGLFPDAAAAVAEVPTEYAVNAEYRIADLTSNPFGVGYLMTTRGVGDGEGGNGIDFVSAGDPRLPTVLVKTGPDGTPMYRPAKYDGEESPIVFASGVEARLIEAEAALHAGSGTWLTILNTLRTTCTDAGTCPATAPAGTGGVAGLPPLTDPGTPNARLDLVFRERAFWLYGTGHRLGDLRRLVSRYSRSAESVFPTGTYWMGGGYSTGTSLPFPATLEAPFNPAVTGCTSR